MCIRDSRLDGDHGLVDHGGGGVGGGHDAHDQAGRSRNLQNLLFRILGDDAHGLHVLDVLVQQLSLIHIFRYQRRADASSAYGSRPSESRL